MSANTLIDEAKKDGLRFSVTPSRTIKLVGSKVVAEKWVLRLREHKTEIIELLAKVSAANDETARTDETEALMIARRAIAMAALTDEQKTKRLADLHRDPGLAAFWLACGRKP